MFCVAVLPFADLRSFVDAPTGRLARPTWPLAEPGRDYVRSSGIVERRKRGGVDGWEGEGVYGRADHALRHVGRLSARELGPGALRARGLFRRFYCDGCAARLEVGLRLSGRGRPARALGARELVGVLRDVLDLPVRVPAGRGDAREVRLATAGRELARHYLRATTRRSEGKWPELEDWWLADGRPLVVVEASGAVLTELPPHATRVERSPVEGVAFAHAWLEVREPPAVGVWLLLQGAGADRERMRQARIHLMRLHAEREALRLVLLGLARGRLAIEPGRPSSDEIQHALSEGVRLLERRARYGIEQAPLLEATKDWTEHADPGQRATLAAQLEKARRSVRVKVERFVAESRAGARVINHISVEIQKVDMSMKKIEFGGDVTVTGDFNAVVADKIQGSFNRVQGSTAPPELKQLLEDLAKQVAEMTKAMETPQAEAAARDLEVLTAEALSAEPRRRWWELSGEGLIEAAKAVGGAAKPVVATVKALMALLA